MTRDQRFAIWCFGLMLAAAAVIAGSCHRRDVELDRSFHCQDKAQRFAPTERDKPRWDTLETSSTDPTRHVHFPAGDCAGPGCTPQAWRDANEKVGK